MATKIKQIVDSKGTDTLLFSSWLSAQGINRAEQAAYVQSGWLVDDHSLGANINRHR